MATRFYLPASGTAPVTPAFGSQWTVTTGAAVRPAPTVKSGTVLTTSTGVVPGSATNPSDRCLAVFVSDALTAQTIAAGTFSAVVAGSENNALAEAWLDVVIRVVSGDGATQRGVLYAGSASNTVSATASAENGEFGTTLATRIKSAIATSSVVCQAGDRVVIEVGTRKATTNNTYTHSLRFGDPTAGTDYALTAGTTTVTSVPWVELSANLTFVSALGDVSMPGAATTAESDGAATLSIARPSGLADGDVLLFVNTWSYDGTDPAAPSEGFTALGEDKTQGSDPTSPCVRVAAKVITNAAGEPATYAMSASATGNNAAVLIPLRGVVTAIGTLVALALAGTVTANSTSQTLASRTPAAGDVPLLYVEIFASQFYTASKNTTWTKPAQAVQLGQISAVFNNVLVAAESVTVASAIGTRVATVSQSASAGRTVSIGLKIGSAPAGPTVPPGSFFHVLAA